MDENADGLTMAWKVTEGSLPPGWRLVGLRCASTGLSPEQRSDDWIAVAEGPAGQDVSFRAADPYAALAGLRQECGEVSLSDATRTRGS